MANAACCVGNSSSFLREAAFLGVPSVIIGNRQIGREQGDNVKNCDYDTEKIAENIQIQLQHGPYAPDLRYGDGNSGRAIADNIAQIEGVTLNKAVIYPDLINAVSSEPTKTSVK